MISQGVSEHTQAHLRFPNADSLHRVVKIALDTGEVTTVEAGYDLLRSYRMGAPANTVDHVKKRFVHAIHMSPVDATEHVLQLCGSEDRPEPDTQIGTLVSGCCSLCFNLVPIKRIEG